MQYLWIVLAASPPARSTKRCSLGAALPPPDPHAGSNTYPCEPNGGGAGAAKPPPHPHHWDVLIAESPYAKGCGPGEAAPQALQTTRLRKSQASSHHGSRGT